MSAQKMKIKLLILILMISTLDSKCQETVFGLFKTDENLADKYYQERNFNSALELYVQEKNINDSEINLKIARCYFFMKQYAQSISYYDKHPGANSPLTLPDIYNYAEAQSYISNYTLALDYYRQYLKRDPDNQLIVKKIWQISNRQYLYEDSLHYALRPINVNSDYGDLCAVPINNGIVFLSNRKTTKLVEKIDASLNTPFYHLYRAKNLPDTIGSGTTQYARPEYFIRELSSKHHAGPIAFYDNEQKIVFTANSAEPGEHGEKPLQLYFASQKNGKWKITSSFPFNNPNYSLSDPTINQQGTLLYFTSDMPGGFGGKDIYKSEYTNNQWTKPENLGANINTAYDEVFPFVHYNTLYFSSNGHAGLGGLDVFKTEILNDGFSEPQNVGYPLNTNNDEFGIVLDSLKTHGYISSNRKNGGYDDDIYEFDIDLQTYPLQIGGLIKYKEHNFDDSLELKTMNNVRLQLIDVIRNITVHESIADENGNFSIVIPYFSKYKIKVTDEAEDEYFVSLEIPKHKTEYTNHEIVIVKDAFKPHEN